jgi:hypothetical protein
MRLPRFAAVALMGATAFCATVPAALADSSGEIEASPQAVHPGGTVQLSTEDCKTPAKVSVVIDGKRYWIWLNHRTSEGITGWFKVPRDTDPGKYTVEGRCDDRDRDKCEHHGREIEGSFWVKKDDHDKCKHHKREHKREHGHEHEERAMPEHNEVGK